MQKSHLVIGAAAALAMTAMTAMTPASGFAQTSRAHTNHAPHAPAAVLAVSHASSHATAHAPAALDDPTIAAIFDAANTWDINLGKLALKKSHNKEIRTFADMMVRDHTAARQLGRDLVAKLHVTPTPPGKDFPLYKDYVATTAKLNGLSGAAFDKAYIAHEAWYHQAVIDAITNTLLPATQNAELKDLQVKLAPNFQAHLAAAKDIEQKLGK